MDKIFQRQKVFQQLLNNDITSQKFRNDMFLGIFSEINEVMNECEWKSWKKQQNFDREKFVDELVDVQIFLVNLLLSVNCDDKEFKKKIYEKIDINFKRQKNAY